MSANVALSSRHRSDMATLFDVFCEVGAGGQDGLPVILTKYPEDYNDEHALKSVRQFSFPCGLKDGFSWPGVFYKILNHVSIIMNNGTQDDLDAILTRIYHTDIPNIGDTLQFECHNGMHKKSSQEMFSLQKLEVKVPDITKLPTLREDKFMLEFYNAVSPRQMLAIYARQSVFIPVLPESLLDMVMAPMPFLIGVPKQVLEANVLKDLGEVVIVDLEDKTLQSAHNDVADIPNEVVMYLKGQLKNSSDMGDSISRSFLRANVLLFGGYRMGFVRSESTGVVHWDKEKFVREQRPSFQPFLLSLIGSDGVQYLERFIEERTRALNCGLPISDEFETEIGNMDKLKIQVKDNASDVIGALKDKVTGIQIGAKLNKLTPKDIRKPKNWTLKKGSKSGGFEPMSFDNIQWREPGADSDSSGGSSPRPNDSSNVPVANLIDLDTPIENPVPHSDITSSNSLFLGLEPSPSSSVAPPRPQQVPVVAPIPVGQSTFYTTAIDPFFDPFKTPTSPSEGNTALVNPKNKWETFD
ncbi:dDENN domain protein [Teladorsagia circumcincta]|uniref:DDENN domain protein n=1 Tax=Teladorsagia circumcincta TaxID=45464 RepID=A0A2G9UKH8_TELCI|nr:dDENN domain protein [Teladorsagia circumcincta]